MLNGWMFCTWFLLSPYQSVTLSAPAEAPLGTPIVIAWDKTVGEGDFVTIVAKGAAEGTYESYVYANNNSWETNAPDQEGDYEIRYLSGESGYPTLGRKALKVTSFASSLKAPASVEAGAEVEIHWEGPNGQGDFITIVRSGRAEGEYGDYVYTNRGNPARLQAPEEAGAYEIRYATGRSYKTLASVPLQVGGTQAEVVIAPKVVAGSDVEVTWKGPDNPGDYLTIVPEGTPEGTYEKYVYTKTGSPLKMIAPDKSGRYEVRYLSARKGYTLARQLFEVTAVSATLKAPKEAVAGTVIDIGWEGPGNPYDYLAIATPGMADDAWVRYEYIHKKNPVAFTLPIEPGSYELRYATGQTSTILARSAIKVTPAAQEPGRLRVVRDARDRLDLGSDVGLEIILDASGSMLQKLEGKRRIDIAKAVLTDLVGTKLPAGTPVAIRVFGHKEADSCRTDLEMPLGPLKPDQAADLVGKIQAMNLAKTPIADSLAQVANDLASVKGQRLVVLITDGEETCGGDPAAAIRNLKEQGIDVRVNIVGFAIDDLRLKQTFKLWAELGDGSYFDASGAQQFSQSLASALQIPYDVVNEQGQKVAEGLVGGAAVTVPAGTYEIRTRETKPRILKAVVVSPKQEQTATLR